MRMTFLAAVAVALLPLALPAAAQVRVMGSTPRGHDPLNLALPGGPQGQPMMAAEPLAPLTLSPVPLTLAGGGQAQTHGDETFRPEVGQEGKDVIWVPTPDSLVKAMLTTARVTAQDRVVDLGAGDGRIAIAAGRDFGARAHGIEYNPDMVALARRNARRANVADRVTFEQGDIFKSDFSYATVVTLYLLPSLNEKLRPTLLAMRPGTRIVSHAFDMGDWEADQTISTDDATGYFWIVPARVEGRWAFEVGAERFVVDLAQTHQMLSTARGAPVTGGRLAGTAITLNRQGAQALTGTVAGDRMAGTGWSATRVRAATG